MLEGNEANCQQDVRGQSNGGAGGQNRGFGNGALGNSGTGGLLIIIAKSIINNGSIVSRETDGREGTSWGAAGGGSGGGCPLIFYTNEFKQGTIDVSGGLCTATGSTSGATAGSGFLEIKKINYEFL